MLRYWELIKLNFCVKIMQHKSIIQIVVKAISCYLKIQKYFLTIQKINFPPATTTYLKIFKVF